MIIKTGRYYILEGGNNAYNEEEYYQLRKNEYEESIDVAKGYDGVELITFEEFLQEPDLELKYILEVDVEEIKKCETLEELNTHMRSELCSEGLSCDMSDDNYKFAIDNNSYAYKLADDLCIDVEYEILDKDTNEHDKGKVAVRVKHLYFV